MANTRPVFHRGVVLGNNEEDTMPAFRDAAARGRGFECDIHPSADNTFVIMHDGTWDRMTPYTGRIADTTQAKIDTMHTNGGAVIPSLRQVLTLTADSAPILIDMKVADPWPDEMIVKMDGLLTDAGAQNRSFVFVSDKDLIARLRELAPNARISYRPVDVSYNVGETQNMGCSAIQPALDTLTQDRVDKFQAAGLRVIVQGEGIDTKSDLDHARNLGVDYVLIDADKWDRWT